MLSATIPHPRPTAIFMALGDLGGGDLGNVFGLLGDLGSFM